MLSHNTKARRFEATKFSFSRRRTRKNAEIENHEKHKKAFCLNPRQPPRPAVPAVSGKPAAFRTADSVRPEAVLAPLRIQATAFGTGLQKHPTLATIVPLVLHYMSKPSYENARHGNRQFKPPCGGAMRIIGTVFLAMLAWLDRLARYGALPVFYSLINKGEHIIPMGWRA